MSRSNPAALMSARRRSSVWQGGSTCRISFAVAEDHRFDVQIERCFGKKIAVDPATVAFDAAKDQLHALQTHNAQASPPERQVLKLEIEEALAQLGAAKAALATT